MLGAFTPHSLPKSLLFLIELTAGTRIWELGVALESRQGKGDLI